MEGPCCHRSLPERDHGTCWCCKGFARSSCVLSPDIRWRGFASLKFSGLSDTKKILPATFRALAESSLFAAWHNAMHIWLQDVRTRQVTRNVLSGLRMVSVTKIQAGCTATADCPARAVAPSTTSMVSASISAAVSAKSCYSALSCHRNMQDRNCRKVTNIICHQPKGIMKHL